MDPIAANPAAPETERLYPIRTVAQLTQVNPITLRAWERRYNLIRPVRTPAGHRLYSDADIRRIREILELSEQGIGLAQIAAIVTQRAAAASPASPRPPKKASAETLHPPQRADSQGSWSARLEIAVRDMDSAEVTRIEQEALLWLPPRQLFDSVLLPVLSRLEQPDSRKEQELARHWFSDRLRTRLQGMFEIQGRPPSLDTPKVAVDLADGPRPMRAAEYHLLLQLGILTQIRLTPTTLNQNQTTDLVCKWRPDGWVRLAPPDDAEARRHPDTLTKEPRCPNTMIIPCTPLDDMDGATGDSTETGNNWLRGTANQCYRSIFERLRRRSGTVTPP